MRTTSLLGGAISLAVAAEAACPMMTGELNGRAIPDNHPHAFDRREADGDTDDFLSQFYLNDNNSYLTSDVGGPIADQNSLKAGERGPTLLEDFVFRQKIQHFDHERVRHCSCLIIWDFRLTCNRSPNVRCMPVVLAPTECSLPTQTGPTSLLRPSSALLARRLLSLPVSRLLPEAGAAQTLREMSTDSRFDSTPTRATMVCRDRGGYKINC